MEDFLHQGGRDVVGTAEPGEGAAGLEERERGAGRGAEIEQALRGAALGLGGEVARTADERENVGLHRRRHMDGVDLHAELEEFRAAGDGLDLRLLGDLAPHFHHGGLLEGGRVVDEELEEEAVGLRLGQRVGALLLDRVLRRHDEEGPRELVRVAADGDLPLLHGLEEGRLDLGRGAVDFVGQDEVGEDRTLVGGEAAVLRREDHRAHDVARQQVGRELDALELDAEGGAQGLDEERLREAGHALKEDVAVGQEGDQHAFDDGILADDGAADFIA